jgi:hypothetical protein
VRYPRPSSVQGTPSGPGHPCDKAVTSGGVPGLRSTYNRRGWAEPAAGQTCGASGVRAAAAPGTTPRTRSPVARLSGQGCDHLHERPSSEVPLCDGEVQGKPPMASRKPGRMLAFTTLLGSSGARRFIKQLRHIT